MVTEPSRSFSSAAELEETITQRWVMLLLSCLFVAVPWLCVTFPPIADLPQQLAQIRLFMEALTDPHSPYLVQWTTPNRLVYVLVWMCWQLLPLSWVGSVNW